MNAAALGLACLLTALASPPFHQHVETGPRTLIVDRVEQMPTIDGDLSDPAWARIRPVGGFLKTGGEQAAAAQTLVWMGFSEAGLHVAVACADNDVSAQPAKHNADTVWQDDCFELFIDPVHRGERQYHVIFNAAGAQYDEVIGGGEVGEWSVATQRAAWGWSAEAVIPYASLGWSHGPPARGTVWRLKLTRNNIGRDTEPSSWTRMGAAFDDASAFADLVFVSRSLVGAAGEVEGAALPAGWNIVTSGDGAGDCRPIDADGQRGYEVRWTGTSWNLRFHPVQPTKVAIPATYLFAAEVRLLSRQGSAILRFARGAHRQIDRQAGWTLYEIPVAFEVGSVVEGADLHLAHGQDSIVQIRNVSIRIDDRPSLAEGVMCLTGNAPPGLAQRNARTAGGRYTWRESWSDADRFPPYIHWPDRGAPERHYRIGGWINFADGVLTDGDLQTSAGFPIYSTAINGHDIVIDLGDDHVVTAVHVVSPRPILRRVALYAKASEDPCDTPVADTCDRVAQQGGFPRRSVMELDGLDMTARLLRLNVSVSHDRYVGPAEVRVWGHAPKAGEPRRAIKAYEPNAGRSAIASPQAIELPQAPQRMVFPVPRELKWGDGVMSVTGETAIVAAEDAMPAVQLLADQWRDLTGVALRIGAAGGPAIRLQRAELGHAEACRLEITPGGATLTGNDDAGLRWAVQSLLWLIEHDGSGWQLPAVTINDHPRIPIRLVQGAAKLTPGLIAALARFKVNYYIHNTYPHIEPIPAGIAEAARRFGVQIIPTAGPHLTMLSDQPQFVERAEGESLEQLPSGRRNPNVGKEAFWQAYEKMLDAAVPSYNGEYVLLGLDEMYQRNNGSRWNESPESRARGMNGHELLAWTINRIHRYLKEKFGKRALIIDSPIANRGISHRGDEANDWRKLPEPLDKDILVYCLDYNAPATRDVLHDNGFRTLYWCMIPTVGEHFPRVYDGMFLNLADGPFHLANIARLAQVCWSPEQLEPSHPQYWGYAEAALPEFRSLHTGLAAPSRSRGGKQFIPVDLSGAANWSRIDARAGDGEGWVDLGPQLDLRALAAGRQVLGGIPFDILDEAKNAGRSVVMVHNRGRIDRSLPQRVTIPVEGRVDSLVFLHTLSRKPGQTYHRKAELAGQYYIIYADDTFATCDIKYNINAANWDGLDTDWDYAPKGAALKSGRHVWRGQTGSGVLADLYSAEWINPRPSVAVRRVVLASPQMKTVADPMLIALTAVRLSAKPVDQPDVPWLDRRPIERLALDAPTGEPIDLSGGVLEDFGVYVSPDGTRITAPGLGSKNDKAGRDPGTAGCENFFAPVDQVLHDNNEWVGRAVTVTFPQPRPLTGAGVIGAYRFEIYHNDFPASVAGDGRPLRIEISHDGETFQTAREFDHYNPETEGLRIAPLDPGRPVKALRFSGMDIAFIQLAGYDSSNGKPR